ncbi:hypothetical protein [Acinetobacter lwoffii]|uniref:hypothetical protein n=1 Tax=Acinetobacter lwoffii TaxID=28090 RepID=UPI003F928B12
MKRFVPMLMIGAIVFSAGCSSSDAPKDNSMSENKHESHSMHHDMNGSAKTDNPSTNAYMEVNTRMHSGMGIDFTGNADTDFMLGMIPHHQGIGIYTIPELCVKLKSMLFNLTSLAWTSVLSSAITAL